MVDSTLNTAGWARELCRAFGLDPDLTLSIDIRIRPAEPPTAAVTVLAAGKPTDLLLQLRYRGDA